MKFSSLSGVKFPGLSGGRFRLGFMIIHLLRAFFCLEKKKMTTLTIMVQSLQGLSHEVIFTPLTNMLVQTNWDSGKSSKYQREFTSFDSSIPFSAATSSE